VEGSLRATPFKRATALLELDRGKTLVVVATTLGVTTRAVANGRARYETTGLACLHDAPRSGRPVEIDGPQRAKITALAGCAAPQGFARWTLHLLAEKAGESELCAYVSHAFVADVLKKTT
jgi:transposase